MSQILSASSGHNYPLTTVLKTKLRLYGWGQYYEKMLYDNALLVRAYLHAWQITGDPSFRRVVEQTLNFVAREMSHPDGGFYSSLDADSEGEEGKFYVWTADEIRAALEENPGFSEKPGFSNYDFFTAAYGITNQGNWEAQTILQRALDDATLAARFHLDLEAVAAKLAECHARLLALRAARVRPGTEDKILTAWNGLMLAAFAEAARVLRSDEFIRPEAITNWGTTEVVPTWYKLATRSAEFMLTHLRHDGRLHRS